MVSSPSAIMWQALHLLNSFSPLAASPSAKAGRASAMNAADAVRTDFMATSRLGCVSKPDHTRARPCCNRQFAAAAVLCCPGVLPERTGYARVCAVSAVRGTDDAGTERGGVRGVVFGGGAGAAAAERAARGGGGGRGSDRPVGGVSRARRGQ